MRVHLARVLQDALRGDHHPQVEDLVVVALQNDPDDVLADVVHVALDGREHHALASPRLPVGRLLALQERHQPGHRPLHHARALDHLRQEHLSGAEEVAHAVHPRHQRPLDHLQGPLGARSGLLRVLLDVVGDPVHQRVPEPRIHWGVAPGQVLALGGRAPPVSPGERRQPLGGARVPVEEHVLHRAQQFVRYLVVDRDRAGVHDPHVHPRPPRVVQEGGVHRLAHPVAAPVGERDVADAPAHQAVRQRPLDPRRRLDEGERVLVVLPDARRHREDVGVEDDVLRREPLLVDQDAVRAGADLHLAVGGRRLAVLVEGHDHDGGPVAADQARLVAKVGLAVLQADRIHDRLALHAPQPGLDHLPARRVDHEGEARDLGLGREQVQEGHHRGLGVEQPLVHVDVDDLRAAPHLLARHLDGRLVVAVADEAGEAPRSRHVRALAHVHEERFGADREGFEAGEAGADGGCGGASGLDAGHRVCDRGDVVGRGAAAASGEVEEAGSREVADGGGHRLGREVVAAELVGEPGVGVAADVGLADRGELLQVGPERVGAERAVEPEGEGRRVAQGVVEGLGGLPGEGAPALVGDGAGDHEGQGGAGPVELLQDREEGGLRVQGVEDGLDHEDVGAALDQRAGLFAVRAAQLLEGDVAGAGVVDVGGDRGGAVHGP